MAEQSLVNVKVGITDARDRDTGNVVYSAYCWITSGEGHVDPFEISEYRSSESEALADLHKRLDRRYRLNGDRVRFQDGHWLDSAGTLSD